MDTFSGTEAVCGEKPLINRAKYRELLKKLKMSEVGEIPCVRYSKGMSFGGTAYPRQFFLRKLRSLRNEIKIDKSPFYYKTPTHFHSTSAKIIQKCCEFKTLLIVFAVNQVTRL